MNTQSTALRLFTHQLLDHEGKPNGVHIGCYELEVVRQSHVDGETSPVIHEWVDAAVFAALVAENERLRGIVPEFLEELNDKLCDENERLTAQRDELLKVLRAMLEQFNYDTITGIVHDESAAIAKARAAIKAVEKRPAGRLGR